MTKQFQLVNKRTKINSVIEKNSKFLPTNADSTQHLPQYPGYE